MNKYVLQTRNLTKSFDKAEILHGIDMSIEYGEVYGLIGQNGAGKTTLLMFTPMSDLKMLRRNSRRCRD